MSRNSASRFLSNKRVRYEFFKYFMDKNAASHTYVLPNNTNVSLLAVAYLDTEMHPSKFQEDLFDDEICSAVAHHFLIL